MVPRMEHHVQARRLVPSRTSDRHQRAQTTSGFRTQAAQMLYKVWDENGRSPVSGQGAWRIPQQDQPGKWMPPVRGDLASGTRGYHLCRPQDLPNRLGPVIYEAEWRGEQLDTPAGALVREARLVRRLPTWDQSTAWMFACDCAEHVLPLFEREHPYDDRPRQAGRRGGSCRPRSIPSSQRIMPSALWLPTSMDSMTPTGLTWESA
jgi:hypothetical protein